MEWPHGRESEPSFVAAGADEPPGDGDVFLLIAPSRETAERFEAVGVPVIVVGDGPQPRRGLRLPKDVDPSVVLGAVSGLAFRSREVLCLQHELSLATRVAQGVEAELGRLDEELQMAALLQQEFLPRPLPPTDDLEYAALWRPASAVSGDLYDVFRLDRTRIGLFLADAVGHGVPAALQAMMLCRSLPTRDLHDRFQRLLTPSEALSRLNCDMADRQGRIGRYATALYAILDCATGLVRVASAGAPVPLVFRGDGRVEAVDASGPLLGIAPQQTYEEIVIRLGPGDRILFHSDGFEQAFRDEARRDDRLAPRYIDELTALRDAVSPAEVVERLASRLDREQGSLHQRDDCTLLVAKPRLSALASAA
jgi:serine phosphatase RsbU (regulator of sigma subunit)